ncbi:MAG TPA: response regulator [Candidatus Binatia bacterium]|nr:response regulator [Candidatus Binatia bacterium]
MSGEGTNLILVVDDNEPARYTKVRILRDAGYEVVEAATGDEALRLVAEWVPRLILLDVNLPGVDGWEVCRRLKADPATASVAVLQVSATHVREEDTVRALEGGADASLTEPIEPAVLVATVRALLRARLAEDALRDALAREQTTRAAAEAANRTKDEFLATLSHELRSPLGVILTWVTLLRSGRIDEAGRTRAYQAIERNTRHQAKLIEDLLDVSRIISGKMRLDVGVVDLAEVVDAAREGVRHAAEAKRIQLAVLPPAAVGPVSGDANRLQQVIWNLLSNAIKFTPRGGQVTVGVARVDSQAQIQVVDSGRGIDPAFLPHIFERFRQADSSTTRSEGGLGLGLAIVRHLVELHGGTVGAESTGVGQGSTFTVRLPLHAVSAPVAAAFPARVLRPPPPAAPLPDLNGVHVLVLDDEPDAREAVAAVLEGCGAHVTPVATVREALAAVERGEAQVVVSDIAMPSEDGYGFITQLRARAGDRGGTLPVIALTAHAGLLERHRILAAGFDEFLAKPIEPRELAGAVAQMAARW